MRRDKNLIIILIVLQLTGILSYGQSNLNNEPSSQRSLTPIKNSPILPKPSQTPKAPLYSINIVSFSASSNPINYGEEVTLRWNIVGRNLERLKIEITPEIGVIPLSRADYKNESFTIEGSKTIRPSKTEKYFLKVSAQDPMPRIDIDKTGHIHQTKILAEKTLIITVRKPKIENVKPLVDQKAMKIKFLAKNTGDGDFISSPIQVEYAVVNNLYGPSLAEGKFTTPNLNIRVGEQVELGEITLPDREKALDGSGALVGVSIYPKYRLPLERDIDNYEYSWETKTLIINNELVSIFGSLLSGSIRINNYRGVFGPITSHDPHKADDCYIEIMGKKEQFSIPKFEHSIWYLGYDYKGYVHDLNAFWKGSNLISISQGKIVSNISFETEGKEIKGWEYTWGNYHDTAAPDYDFTKFDLVVHIKPELKNNKITYSHVEVIPNIKGTFIGGYDYITPESLERKIDEKITKNISQRLIALLMSDSIKSRIEEAIEKSIIKNPLFGIYRIVKFRAEGDQIVIEYIPK